MIRIGSNKLRRTSARRDLWSIDQPIATQITIVILVESDVEEILESDLTLPSASIPPSSSDAPTTTKQPATDEAEELL